jgi:hypothetical protein
VAANETRRWVETDVIGDGRNTHMITHLQADVEYEFEVVAINRYGTGRASDRLKRRTIGLLKHILKHILFQYPSLREKQDLCLIGICPKMLRLIYAYI